MCLYKKCEVCGNKINKLQSIWNIYTLKTGEVIQCHQCSTYYKTNKMIEILSSMYVNMGVGIILWFAFGICIAILLPTMINEDIKFIIAFLLSFLFLNLVNFVIVCTIPLHQTQIPKKEMHKKSFIYLVIIGILIIIVLIAFMKFLWR